MPFLCLMGGAAVTYCAALTLLARRPHGSSRQLAACVALSIAWRVVLAAGPPLASDDVYRYLWDGRVQQYGYSPYAAAPDDPGLAALHTASDAPHRSHQRGPAHGVSAGGAVVLQGRDRGRRIGGGARGRRGGLRPADPAGPLALAPVAGPEPVVGAGLRLAPAGRARGRGRRPRRPGRHAVRGDGGVRPPRAAHADRRDGAGRGHLRQVPAPGARAAAVAPRAAARRVGRRRDRSSCSTCRSWRARCCRRSAR